MDFFETVKARRSCRAYKADSVSEDSVRRILEAFRRAPSWKNSQSWHLIAVSDPDVKRRLGEAARQNPTPTAYAAAPYMFVLCAEPDVSGTRDGQPYYLVDCGIALEHFCLAAAAEGLGTCWVGLFDEAAVKELLHIPDPVRVVALTPLGVPDEGCYRDRTRREIDEIVHRDRW